MKKIKFIIPAAALATCIPAGATLVSIAAKNAAESKVVNAITPTFAIAGPGDGEFTAEPTVDIEEGTKWKDIKATQLKTPSAITETKKRSYFSGWSLSNQADPQTGQYTPIPDNTVLTNDTTLYAIFGLKFTAHFEHSVESVISETSSTINLAWDDTAGETVPSVAWKSSDETVFKIDTEEAPTSKTCKINACNVSEAKSATLTATYCSGVEQHDLSCKIIVQPAGVAVTDMFIYQTNIDYAAGSTEKASLPVPTIFPSDATIQTVTWTVTDTNKFEVVEEDGVWSIQGKGDATTAGVCFAHAVADGNTSVTADVKITVQDKVKTFALSLTGEQPTEIFAGDTEENLGQYIVWPAEISDHRLIWSTNETNPDTKHIKIDANGNIWCISGKTDGKIRITATSAYNREVSISFEIQATGNNYEMEFVSVDHPDYFESSITTENLGSARDKFITISWKALGGTKGDTVILANAKEAPTQSVEINNEGAYAHCFTDEGFTLSGSEAVAYFQQIDTWEKVYVSIKALRYHDLHIINLANDTILNVYLPEDFEFSKTGLVKYSIKEGSEASLNNKTTQLYDQDGEVIENALDLTRQGDISINQTLEKVQKSEKLTLVLSTQESYGYSVTFDTSAGNVGAYVSKMTDDVIDVGVLFNDKLTLQVQDKTEETPLTTYIQIGDDIYDASTKLWEYTETQDPMPTDGNPCHISIDLSKLPEKPGPSTPIKVVLVTAPREFKTDCRPNEEHSEGLANKPMVVDNAMTNSDIKVHFVLDTAMTGYEIDWDVSLTYVALLSKAGQETVLSWDINKQERSGTISIEDPTLLKALEDRGEAFEGWTLLFHVATELA